MQVVQDSIKHMCWDIISQDNIAHILLIQLQIFSQHATADMRPHEVVSQLEQGVSRRIFTRPCKTYLASYLQIDKERGEMRMISKPSEYYSLSFGIFLAPAY